VTHPVTCFYALLCAVAFVAAAFSSLRDRRAALLAIVILTAGCLLSNIGWISHAVGTWKRIDAAAMMLFLWMLWADRRDWKIQLCILAVATMAVHAIFDAADDGSLAKDYGYPAALNALFVLELFVVGRIGAKGALDHGSRWILSTRVRRSRGSVSRRGRHEDK